MLSKIATFQNRNDSRTFMEFMKQFLDGASFKSLSPEDAIRILPSHLDGEALCHYDTCMKQGRNNLKMLILLLADCLTSIQDILYAVSIEDPAVKSPCKKLQIARKINNEGLEGLLNYFIKSYKDGMPPTGFKRLFKKYKKQPKDISQEQIDDSESDTDESSETEPLVCAAVQYEINMQRRCFVCVIHENMDAEDNVITPTAPDAEEELSTAVPLNEPTIYPSIEDEDEFEKDDDFIKQIKDAAVKKAEEVDEFKSDETFIKQINDGKKAFSPDVPQLPQLPSLTTFSVIEQSEKLVLMIENVIKNKSWTDYENNQICSFTKIYLEAQMLSHLVGTFFDLDTYCTFLRYCIKSFNKLPHMAIIKHCGGNIMQPKLKKILSDVIIQHKTPPALNDNNQINNLDYEGFLRAIRAFFMAQPKEMLLVPGILSSNLFRFLKLKIPAFNGVNAAKVAEFCRRTKVLVDLKEARQSAYEIKKQLASPYSTEKTTTD